MTTLAPLLAADLTVQIHAFAALGALVLGPVVLWRRRRDGWHRAGGYLWVALMAVAALSSFGIHGIALVGPFGPIHLLSILTLGMLARGVRAALLRRIAEHQAVMRNLYVWALGVAGLFTLLPGRVMHRVVFGDETLPGFVVLALVVGVAALTATLGARKAA